MHICGIWKNGTDESICKAGIETQTYSTDMWTRWGEGGGVNWEMGTDMNTLPCVNQSGNLLYNARSSARRSVMTEMGGVWGDGREGQEGI